MLTCANRVADLISSKKAKVVVKEYGIEFMVYWTAVWGVTGIGIFAMLHTGIMDGMQLLHVIDNTFDLTLAERVDPSLGNIALAFALNEMIEPLRLPCVVVSTPAVVKKARLLYT